LHQETALGRSMNTTQAISAEAQDEQQDGHGLMRPVRACSNT
jgi:hypothetical protein